MSNHNISYTSIAGMDWELFLELEETPIQPAMLHMEPLQIHGLDPDFQLHVCSQLLFSWSGMREISDVFRAVQNFLIAIGYSLRESSTCRIGKVILTHIYKFLNDLRRLKTKEEKLKRKEHWIKVFIHQEEVDLMPKDVIQKLAANIKELEKVNAQLTSRLEEKGEELFEAFVKPELYFFQLPCWAWVTICCQKHWRLPKLWFYQYRKHDLSATPGNRYETLEVPTKSCGNEIVLCCLKRRRTQMRRNSRKEMTKKDVAKLNRYLSCSATL